MARKQENDAATESSTDAEITPQRPAFETDVNHYQTGDGNALLAEPGAGAAWIECDPDNLVDTGELR